jgi:hypothetical protein
VRDISGAKDRFKQGAPERDRAIGRKTGFHFPDRGDSDLVARSAENRIPLFLIALV